jgi:1-aminocyclopropane-1-carboxylate deaminase
MFVDVRESSQYVTLLDNSWHALDGVDFGILHTERMTEAAIGNKAYKLAHVFTNRGATDRVLSFGGAWSNHLHALAFACNRHGLASVGVVRAGEANSNPLLQSLQRLGMRLHFVSRQEYRRRVEFDYCESLCRDLGCTFWLPEGGSDAFAVDGCSNIGAAVRHCGFEPDLVVLPVGTGATLAGVVNGTGATTRVLGLPVVRDDSVELQIRAWVGQRSDRWSMAPPLSPGYGKSNEALLCFIVRFHAKTGILLDPVYSGKALKHCLETGLRDSGGRRILFLHTGGLMGNYGYIDQFRVLSGCNSALFIDALNQCCQPLTGV